MIVRREGGNEREGKTEKGQKERQRKKTNHFFDSCIDPSSFMMPLEKPIVAKESGSQGNLVNILSHHFMGLGDNIRVWIKTLYEITIPRGALAHFNRNRKITNQK